MARGGCIVLLLLVIMGTVFAPVQTCSAQGMGSSAASAAPGGPDASDPHPLPSDDIDVDPGQAIPRTPSVQPVMASTSSRGTITVNGSWSYQDISGAMKPIRNAYIEMYDSDVGPDDLLQTTWTDANGTFSFSVTNTDDEGGNVDLYTTIYTYSIPANVHDSPYTWNDYSNMSAISTDVPDGTLDMGNTYVPMNAAPPYHIMDTIIDEYNWLKDRTGWSRGMVMVFWPYSDWPDSHGDIIHIPGDANQWEWKDATILHEYAHCIHWTTRGGTFPPGASNAQHHIYSETNDGFALTEGWASFLPCAVLNTTICWNEYVAGDIEDGRAADYLDFGDWDGNIVEGAVAAIFWDLFDNTSWADYPTWSAPFGDNIDSRFDMLWHIFSTKTPYGMGAFWEEWVGAYGASTDLWAIFYHQRMDRDGFLPTGPTGYNSDPLTGNWTNDTTVNVTIEGASDDLSGIWGFNIVWSTTPVDPTNGTWVEGTKLPTQNLSDGVWYLCVIAKDRAGKVAHEYFCNQRPWMLDSAAPDVTVAFQLAGSTMTGVWQPGVSDPVFSWAAPNDGLSGIAGYQVYWGTHPNGTSTSITNETRLDPAQVEEGTHYLRIRVMDKVGNLGNWTTVYVFRFDATPPTNPTTVQQTTGITESGVWQATVKKPFFSWDGQNDSTSGVDGFYIYFGDDPNGTSTLFQTTTTFSPTPVMDGTFYMRVQTRDRADNRAEWATLYIFRCDSTPPTAPVPDDGLGDYSSVSNMTVTWAAPADLSGIAGYYFRLDDGAETWTENTSAAISALSEGFHSIHVNAVDMAGNSGPDGTHNMTIDTMPPSGTIMVVDGQKVTESTLVQLFLTTYDAISGVVEMGFSEDASYWSPWEPYQETAGLYLMPGDGTHTIFVRFRDAAGLVSGPVNTTIMLDTASPTGTIIINGGVSRTTSSMVTLTLSAKDANGISQMRFSDDGITWGQWEDFQTSREYELRSSTGTRAVYVQFRDGAGRASETVSDDILVERKNVDPMSVATSGGVSLWAIVIVLLLIIIIILVVGMMAMKRRQLERAREARLRRKRMQKVRARFKRPKHGPSDAPPQPPRRVGPVRRR